MDKVLVAGQWLVAHGPEIVSAIMALLSGVIAISMLIPGEQPEKALQGVVEFLKKFSKK
jgi:hypothetical protein